MCKPSCCPPQRSSGTGAIIAVITALIIAPALLSVLAQAVRLLALIALTILAAAVLAVAACAVIARRHRLIRRPDPAIGPARRAPATPAVRVLIIAADPATGRPAIHPGRFLTGDHAARQLAALTEPDHPPAGLIRVRRTPRT